MSYFKIAVFMAGALLTYNAQARDQNILFLLGLDVGGDELAKVTYTNGDTDTIDSGGLLHFALGTTFQTLPDSQPHLETQLSLGYKFDISDAENGDLTWDRYPLEILEFYATSRWRLGGGLTYHLSPKLTGSGIASAIQTDFDNALGIVIEADYLSGGRHFVGARVTLIDYEAKASNASISGNSIGATLGLRY